MTHAELVVRAGRWLKRMGCSTVITEKFLDSFEEPDAIGWKANGFSILVEVKTSRDDFRRDAAKPFRVHPTLGMGSHRYFLTAPGLVRPADLPGGWGLVEVRGRRASVVAAAATFVEKATRHELTLLLAYTRRREGVSKRLRPASVSDSHGDIDS